MSAFAYHNFGIWHLVFFACAFFWVIVSYYSYRNDYNYQNFNNIIEYLCFNKDAPKFWLFYNWLSIFIIVFNIFRLICTIFTGGI